MEVPEGYDYRQAPVKIDLAISGENI